jgi:hypothetical protein
VIRRALLAAAVVAAFAPAATANAATTDAAAQEICVMTWHHIGEVCVHHLVPLAKAEAECLATREDKLSCVPNVGQGRTSTAARSCSRPLGLTDECLENTICGLPSRVARAAGLDQHGIDPTVDCVQ